MKANVISLYPSVNCWKVFVRCPYCYAKHSHGAGTVKGRPYLGSRSAHCRSGEYDLTVNSYSSVLGLPSNDPLVSQTLLSRALAAESGVE